MSLQIGPHLLKLFDLAPGRIRIGTTFAKKFSYSFSFAEHAPTQLKGYEAATEAVTGRKIAHKGMRRRLRKKRPTTPEKLTTVTSAPSRLLPPSTPPMKSLPERLEQPVGQRRTAGAEAAAAAAGKVHAVRRRKIVPSAAPLNAQVVETGALNRTEEEKRCESSCILHRERCQMSVLQLLRRNGYQMF